MVGMPNQPISSVPLQPIPVGGEPFCHVQIDCVGLPSNTKSGNQYLLTITCKFTRFPEGIPLWNIKAEKIADSLIKFFTFVELPGYVYTIRQLKVEYHVQVNAESST